VAEKRLVKTLHAPAATCLIGSLALGVGRGTGVDHRKKLAVCLTPERRIVHTSLWHIHFVSILCSWLVALQIYFKAPETCIIWAHCRVEVPICTRVGHIVSCISGEGATSRVVDRLSFEVAHSECLRWGDRRALAGFDFAQ